MSSAPQGTFSIVAADPKTGEVGVAVQSRYFAVGNVVPWAKAGVGAVATQAAGIAAYGPRILAELESDAEPEDAIARILADDGGRESRQLGAVTADGRAAAFTGASCLPWAGHLVGRDFAAQGNILAAEAVVDEMARAFEEADGELAERLVAGLEAGQAAGGDRRGQQSAAVLVERTGAAAERRDGLDRVCDLRVDDHPEPIVELRRLLGIHQRWEVMRRSIKHYEAKRYEEAIEVVRGGLVRFGEDGVLLYSLACFESLAGRRESALVHLGRAVAMSAEYREAARTDDDFASLRDDPDFVRLLET
jgi:uncharacterized Ntn-hydrolase superfamily protein